MRIAPALILTILVGSAASPARAQTDSLEDQIPRLAPTEAKDAIKTFRIDEHLRIELVAAEPRVTDPVDMAFDENGRLFVVELRDYPYDEREGKKPLGRVRLLEDPNGDGRFERSTVFADGFSWPTGLALWDGGVFLLAAPHLYYLKDQDGDRKADRIEVVFTGFGDNNVQALPNNIKWGLDNWFTGAGGQNLGFVRSLRKPELPLVTLNFRDFRFRPTGQFETLSGGYRFGNSFDDFGRRFRCGPNTPINHVVLEQRYLRNPHVPVRNAIHRTIPEGPFAKIFPASPPEPWRMALIRMLAAGKKTGAMVSMDRGVQINGFFTGAAGIVVYRGTALGERYYGDVFVGECANNLVHRRKLKPDGVTFRAERTQADREFLASTDNWFRPVNLAHGPDGALYVCDMYRECIEHPWSIPDKIKRHLDLFSGNDRGRIWRIVRNGARRYETPQLGKASTAELVEALRRPDAWWRETAGRLLYERQDKTAVAPLEKLVVSAELPATRAAALWALEGLGALREAVVEAARKDPVAGVREQAVRLARPLALFDMRETDPRVRMQLAFKMGETNDPRAIEMLARLSPGADSWLRTAIASSMGERPVDLLRRVATEEIAFTLAIVIGARNKDSELAAALKLAGTSPAIVGGLGQGLRRAGRSLADLPGATALLDKAEKTALDRQQTIDRRVTAARLLGFGSFASSQETLLALIDSGQPLRLRTAAMQSMIQMNDPKVGDVLVGSWKQLDSKTQRVAIRWFDNHRRYGELLEAMEKGEIPSDDVSVDLRRTLDRYFRDRTRALLGDTVVSDRRSVVASYGAALEKKGNADRGLLVYRKHCASCHRIKGEGHQAGPDLVTVKAKSPQELIQQILDPNRQIDPQYLNYQVQTTDGKILDGILSASTPKSVTLRRPQQETIVLRANIETFVTTGISLMPEGLEKEIDVQAMADLIEFIRRQ